MGLGEASRADGVVPPNLRVTAKRDRGILGQSVAGLATWCYQGCWRTSRAAIRNRASIKSILALTCQSGLVLAFTFPNKRIPVGSLVLATSMVSTSCLACSGRPNSDMRATDVAILNSSLI